MNRTYKKLFGLFLTVLLLSVNLPCAARGGINNITDETMPQFPGGTKALFKFISDNLRYPKDAYERGIEGRVVVGFTIKKDGSLTDFEILISKDPSLDDEALRVMKCSPRWIPGTRFRSDNKVDVKYQMPITFRLEDVERLNLGSSCSKKCRYLCPPNSSCCSKK